MRCSLSELSTFSSAKKGEIETGEWPATTGDLLLISATINLSPLSNSNEGDTLSFAKCVGYCVSVISTEEEPPTTSGVFLRGGVGCVY